MADLIVSGNSSGSVTLRAPDVSGTTILTLPTTTGTLVVTGGAQTVQFAAGSAAAPSITFTGDTNTGMFSPGADTIAFSEGGVESMRIDASGLIGMATTTLDARLNVKVIGNAYTTGALSIESSLGTKQYITTVSDIMYFGSSNGTDMMCLTANGIGLAANNPTSGVGLKFPATQSASSDANTLDDYEEGTWTPVINGTSTAGTASYSPQNGKYTKIGRLVFVELYIVWTGGTGSGNLSIGGLPFTGSSSTAAYSGLAIGYWNDIAITSGQVPMAYQNSGTTRIDFICMNAGGAGSGTVNYDVAGALQIAGCYTV